MKQAMDWFMTKVIDNRKTVIVGLIAGTALDGLLRARIPLAICSVITVAIGLVCLLSAYRCWGDRRKVQLALMAVCGLMVMVGGVEFFREAREEMAATTPAASYGQSARTEPARTEAPRQQNGTTATQSAGAGSASGSAVAAAQREECDECLGLKTCWHCYGEGDQDCTYCAGGRCLRCSDGHVLVRYDAKGNPKYRDCRDCDGGRCTHCDGSGRVDCRYCLHGECPRCNGTGYKR